MKNTHSKKKIANGSIPSNKRNVHLMANLYNHYSRYVHNPHAWQGTQTSCLLWIAEIQILENAKKLVAIYLTLTILPNKLLSKNCISYQIFIQMADCIMCKSSLVFLSCWLLNFKVEIYVKIKFTNSLEEGGGTSRVNQVDSTNSSSSVGPKRESEKGKSWFLQNCMLLFWLVIIRLKLKS